MTTTFNDTYEIKSLIGRGGMSAVYLAEHKRLHTRWAVKEVRKQQAARFDFLAESNILKRLQHPMLPRIVDIFEDDQCIYIVEDFVEGITLEDLLRRQKRVDETQGLQWFRELCGVLRYLHTQQPHPIIYRDMKPSNVMLQPDGSSPLKGMPAPPPVVSPTIFTWSKQCIYLTNSLAALYTDRLVSTTTCFCQRSPAEGKIYCAWRDEKSLCPLPVLCCI